MLLRLVGGFVQAAAGVAVAAWRLSAGRVHAGGDEAELFVHGFSHYVAFLVATPWGWLALWLFVEGLLRVLAAAMEQPFGTAPLSLARAAWAARPRAKLADDVVTKRGDAIVIDSARDYDWHALTTIEHDGALYAVTRAAGVGGERPHRYRLTPITPEHVVRTVTRHPPPRRRAS